MKLIINKFDPYLFSYTSAIVMGLLLYDNFYENKSFIFLFAFNLFLSSLVFNNFFVKEILLKKSSILNISDREKVIYLITSKYCLITLVLFLGLLFFFYNSKIFLFSFLIILKILFKLGLNLKKKLIFYYNIPINIFWIFLILLSKNAVNNFLLNSFKIFITIQFIYYLILFAKFIKKYKLNFSDLRINYISIKILTFFILKDVWKLYFFFSFLLFLLHNKPLDLSVIFALVVIFFASYKTSDFIKEKINRNLIDFFYPKYNFRITYIINTIIFLFYLLLNIFYFFLGQNMPTNFLIIFILIYFASIYLSLKKNLI
jgi:hypothetical protein